MKRTGAGWLREWRLPLLMARRDAFRARGRSLLVLTMIALPVLAVTAADVVLQTQSVSAVESLDRRLGAADALVSTQPGVGRVAQAPDPDRIAFPTGAAGDPLTPAQVSAELDDARLIERRTGEIRFSTDQGVARAEGTELDLGDPASVGLFDLVSGRLPRSTEEVVVNRALADKGPQIGDRLELSGGTPSRLVVGIAESTTLRDHPVAAGALGSLGLATDNLSSWLVAGGPVTWDDVLRLNAAGATVLSRAVLLDPPPVQAQASEVRQMSGGGVDRTWLTVVVLVVVMALIEVVLLAGPAFAVGARRQSRTLALLAATGGTPRQARRVVLAGAVVLGVTAALLGAVLGVILAYGAIPLLQRRSAMWFGPFEVPWLQLAGIMAFGVSSALLAAVVPAHIASRQDVVAVLAGRRGDRAPSLRSPLVGLLLLGLGVAGAVAGATRTSGELLIAASAILSVLGMILLIPVLLAGLARVSGRLPLTLRYAVRDAARHRTRTVPAVAAVAATVAGVVALGIATTSDAYENEQTYVPSTTSGVGVLTSYGQRPDWPALRALVEREAPGATVHQINGLPQGDESEGATYLRIVRPGTEEAFRTNYGAVLGSDLLVSDDVLPPGLVGVSTASADRAASALRAGGLVVFTDEAAPDTTVPVTAIAQTFASVGDGSEGQERSVDLPATLVQVPPSNGPQAVLSSQAAKALGVPTSLVGLALDGTDLTEAQESSIAEGSAGISPSAYFRVERGFRAEDSTRIVQLVLAGLGAVLMLGGTLTATFLALSDARPDLATLSAVGASPRRRRGIASAYAIVVGLVGAVVGAVVGFIPGIAITYPLTTVGSFVTADEGGTFVAGTGSGTGPFLDIPWLLIAGVVLLLPIATALIVGLAARSRLPLVRRVD